MARSIFLSPCFEVAVSRSYFFTQYRRFSFFAGFAVPAGSPRFEVSRHERGHGVRLIVGPLLVDAGV